MQRTRPERVVGYRIVTKHDMILDMDNNDKKDLKEIRWKQRFSNFEKAYLQLETALREDTVGNALFRAALIQTFEFTMELGWKTLKDRLEAGGIITKLPRDTIKESLQVGFIDDGKTWIEMLDTRNELSHGYSEELSIKAEKVIRLSFYPILKKLYEDLKKLT